MKKGGKNMNRLGGKVKPGLKDRGKQGVLSLHLVSHLWLLLEHSVSHKGRLHSLASEDFPRNAKWALGCSELPWRFGIQS